MILGDFVRALRRFLGVVTPVPGGVPFPFPLINFEKRVAFHWMPRCGCTTLTSWFFDGLGRRREIEQLGTTERGAGLSYAELVHLYRDTVWNPSLEPQRVEAVAANPAFERCVLVRDPYKRPVSSYLGYMRGAFDFFRAAFAMPDLTQEQIQTQFSFRRFVSLLDRVDLDDCDPHLMRQSALPCWRGGPEPDHVLCVETLDEDLKRLSASLALPPPADSHLVRKKAPHKATSGLPDLDYRSIEALAAKAGEPGRKVFPLNMVFYDAELRTQVRRLYAEDFVRLGYEALP